MREYTIKPFGSTLKNSLDQDGQPLNSNFNRGMVRGRTLDELIGICKGITADGVVATEEAEFLARWLKGNQSVIEEWPANVLAERIANIFYDNIVTSEEKQELFDLLREVTGGSSLTDHADNLSTELPFDDPLPDVVFDNRQFCFTGKFCIGTRQQCESEVITRKGIVQKQPTYSTNYLVIGILGSRDWIHSTHGRKIEAAVEFRDKPTARISIIPEKHWAAYL
jgi:hypothetical protein